MIAESKILSATTLYKLASLHLSHIMPVRMPITVMVKYLMYTASCQEKSENKSSGKNLA